MGNRFDVLVVGGGLSGLVSAIQLAKKGASVALFDKGVYPRNRVCGEFLSGPAIQILEDLGIDAPELKSVVIDRFRMTNVNGKHSETLFPEPSYGVSRYWLENELAQLAQTLGIELHAETSVKAVERKSDNLFQVVLKDGVEYFSEVVIGAFGKRSSLQLNELKRSSFFAVKNYYRSNIASNEVSLNLFEGGYAGLSQVENGWVNCCYMGKSEDLKHHGSIEEYEKQVLWKNPNLHEFFASSEAVWEKPMTISQIYFGKRKKVENGVLNVGDAAGMIFPLSGNGMTIAVSGALQTANEVIRYLDGAIFRFELEENHSKGWTKQFSKKLVLGKGFQMLLEHKQGGNIAVPFLNLPLLGTKTISLVHG